MTPDKEGIFAAVHILPGSLAQTPASKLQIPQGGMRLKNNYTMRNLRVPLSDKAADCLLEHQNILGGSTTIQQVSAQPKELRQCRLGISFCDGKRIRLHAGIEASSRVSRQQSHTAGRMGLSGQPRLCSWC
eukprot:1139217-Pelagomonas_calceolata.AAC.6